MFNDFVFQALREKGETMSADCKLCVVLFDDMSTNEGLNYDPATDRVEGVEDMGVIGRTKYISIHAMVSIRIVIHGRLFSYLE